MIKITWIMKIFHYHNSRNLIVRRNSVSLFRHSLVLFLQSFQTRLFAQLIKDMIRSPLRKALSPTRRRGLNMRRLSSYFGDKEIIWVTTHFKRAPFMVGICHGWSRGVKRTHCMLQFYCYYFSAALAQKVTIIRWGQKALFIFRHKGESS